MSAERARASVLVVAAVHQSDGSRSSVDDVRDYNYPESAESSVTQRNVTR